MCGGPPVQIQQWSRINFWRTLEVLFLCRVIRIFISVLMRLNPIFWTHERWEMFFLWIKLWRPIILRLTPNDQAQISNPVISTALSWWDTNNIGGVHQNQKKVTPLVRVLHDPQFQLYPPSLVESALKSALKSNLESSENPPSYGICPYLESDLKSAVESDLYIRPQGTESNLKVGSKSDKKNDLREQVPTSGSRFRPHGTESTFRGWGWIWNLPSKSKMPTEYQSKNYYDQIYFVNSMFDGIKGNFIYSIENVCCYRKLVILMSHIQNPPI